MPYHQLICTGCRARFDLMAKAGDERPACPDCGEALDTDWQRQGAPSIQRTWHGAETRSLSHGLAPQQLEAYTRECPSWQFDPATGDAIFENDAHMRRCLKEQQALDRREEERHEERVAKARERGELATDPLTGQELPTERTDLRTPDPVH